VRSLQNGKRGGGGQKESEERFGLRGRSWLEGKICRIQKHVKATIGKNYMRHFESVKNGGGERGKGVKYL